MKTKKEQLTSKLTKKTVKCDECGTKGKPDVVGSWSLVVRPNKKGALELQLLCTDCRP